MEFQDRRDAGKCLAAALIQYRDRTDVIVLGLPRGGIPVAFEIARELHLPMDVFVVRKLGVPGHEELAMGAIAAGGILVTNERVMRVYSLPSNVIESVIAKETRELNRRQMLYRDDRPWPDLQGWTILLVDDGLATGATMRAAVEALRQQSPSRIVVAVPVGAADSCAQMAKAADEVVCLETPDPFKAVGYWYRAFEATTDEEVRKLLSESAAPPLAGRS